MTLIADRYELGDRLGMGGMSTVRVAYDRRLEREVAVKLLAEHLAGDEQFVARFKREALAAARLVHPNIVQVFDFGYDRATHHHYIVMERIVGPSGALILRERGHVPPDEGVHWIEQACRGLEHAHRHGVIHRDVKPGNLLLSEGDGTVKLADFGIAKAASDVSGITQIGSVLGTAAYLAPEQAAGEQAGPRSDLYGLGVVAYQLLSGRLPYDAASLTELVLLQQQQRPTPLDRIDDRIEPELAGAVERALELDPRDRFESADEMRDAVLEGARGLGDAATGATRIVMPATDATSVQSAQPRVARAPGYPDPYEDDYDYSRAAQRHERQPRKKRRSLAPLLTVLVLLAVIAVAAYVLLTREVPPQLQDVSQDKATQVLDALEQMVRDNTR